MRHRNLTLAFFGLFLVPTTLTAQPCAPTFIGFPSGPQPVASSPAAVLELMPFEDASGPSLIAAGKFSLAGSNQSDVSVARYQSGRWTKLGTTTLPVIRALAQADFSANGGPGLSIYAAGDSSTVRRWDGNQWVQVGTGNAPSGPIDTLLSYSDSEGPVLLATSSQAPGIKAWRGTGAWTSLPTTGLTGFVRHLKVLDDGSGPALFAIGGNIAKLVQGQWQPCETPPVMSFSYFEDMVFFDDGASTTGPEPYVSGAFLMPSSLGTAARKRNGVWEPLGGGLFSQAESIGSKWFIIDEGTGPTLYLGGPVQQNNQSLPYAGLVKWTAAGWHAPFFLWREAGNSRGAVYSVVRFNDGLGERTFFSGGFDSFSTTNVQSAVLPAPAVIQSDGVTIESMDRGLGALIPGTASAVRYDLATLNLPEGSRLLAAGPFLRAGGRSAYPAALFDGQDWTALSLPMQTPSALHRAALATVDGQVRIFAGIHNSTALGLLIYWDGAQWVRFPVQPPGANVGQIATFNGTLHVFTNAGLYRFTGTSWQSLASWSSLIAVATLGDLGSGQRLYFAAQGSSGPGVYEFDGVNIALVGPALSTAPSSLHIHDDGSGPALYIAGQGTQRIQRLYNNAWEPISPNFPTSWTSPIALASFDDGSGPALYAAGGFTSIGTVQTNGFARWQHNTWSPVFPYAQTPMVGIERASLAVFNDRLYLAGDFKQLNGVAADHLAYVTACPRTCIADFDGDGDYGTDADIEAFFACLAGNCCPRCTADFNADGDYGTDADIEAFFRVLAGGAC